MTTEQLTNFALRNLFHQYDFVTHEMGPYHSGIRFDLIGIRRWNRTTRIMEIKVSRSDFLSDKKWKSYLEWATYFYFLTPRGLIHPKEISDQRAGLIEVAEVGNGYYRYEIVKKCRKLPPLSIEKYLALVEAVAWRQRAV